MMMLDSSLGKILSTTKPVEPSIPGNSDHSEVKDDAVAGTTRSEAEVRIVFRFFVEEQIVYNGKIEQVKQLESEELSRIVSRIAWDGAKDEKQPVLDREPKENGKIMDSPKNDTGQADCHHSPDASRSLCVSTNNIPAVKDVPEEACDNDYVAKDVHYTSLECTVPTETVKIVTIDRVSPNQNARLTPENPTCDDAKILLNSYHICETDTHLNSSYNIQENDKRQRSIGDQDQSYQKDKLLDDEALPPINDPISDDTTVDEAAAAAEAEAAAVDSQMIVEALYDCVYNVDLESRKSDLETTVNNEFANPEPTQQTKVDPDDAGRDLHEEDVIDTSREVAKVDKKPLAEAANVPPNQDITRETISNSDDSYLKNKGARSHQTCKDDLNLRTNPTKKSDIILASRRRNTCDTATTTNRRIRRSGSKDLRASRISTAVSHGENGGQIEVTNEDMDHPSRHFACQSKVFAKWSDNHFYPGTVVKSARDRKLEIGFFDGARKDVVETDLIPLSNILCKQVRVSIAKEYCVNAIVHEQLSNNGQPMFDVSYQQNGLVRKCVPLSDIFLTADQGLPLINQPIRPDKNPDESMFAGVDLDNIVHNKRSRRLQEMEDIEMSAESLGQPSNISPVTGRRKRGQYNTRTSTGRARSGNTKVEIPNERGLKRSHSDVNNQDTPISSCSPDNIKPQLHSSNSNPPSESSSSTGSTNSAANGHDIGQEFYFESTSPHRTKTSLLS